MDEKSEYTHGRIMYSRFHYILILLIIMSVYLIYLIGYYTIQQFQTTSFLEGLESANSETTESNVQKEFLAQYILTPAYQTQVAKATHNKRLPGEEVINIIRPDDANSNKDVDSATVIAAARSKEENPMKNMTNPQKWWYLLKTWL